MFTHRNNEKSNERGALMIEAIALLGLMTMMSPMIVRQTADRTSEMEEVAIAGQMKEIKDALSNWIEANYQEKAKELSAASASDDSFTVTATDLAPYLPATYLTDTGTFKGNKLVDGFDVGVRAQCTEARSNACTPSSTDDCSCGTRTNGMITGLSADCTCSRYKMTGVVLSKTDDSTELDDRRAARIASMIGADGGYMRTANMVNAIATNDTAESEMKKILGSQGIWEGDVTNYFDAAASGIDLTKGGRIAATTIYSSGFSGDYLYRKKVDGLPGANSMFTDLDMGGATNCEGDGCHNINNAGGLEVVGGKILIRSKNDEDDQSIGSGDSYAKIALGLDDSHIMSSNSIHLSITDNVSNKDYAPHLSLNQDRAQMFIYGGAEGSASIVDLTPDQLTLQAGHYGHGWASSLTMNKDDTMLSSGNITLDADETVAVNGNTVSVFTPQRFEVNAGYAANAGLSQIYATPTNINITSKLGASFGGFASNATQSSLFARDASADGGYGHSNVNVTSDSILMDVNKSAALNLNRTGIYANFTNQSDTRKPTSSFALNETNFVVNIGGNLTNTTIPLYQMNFNKSGLTLHANSNQQKIMFTLVNTTNSTDPRVDNIVNLVASKNGTGVSEFANRRGPALVVEGSTGKRLIAFYPQSGRISGSFFQPEALSLHNGEIDPIIQGRAAITIEENGLTKANSAYLTNLFINGSNSAQTAAIAINMSGENVVSRPYHAHDDDHNYYAHFRVDPAFISVMNDIKVTSRGGARLSESLPNYILKGIYELSNSYGSGPWPCRAQTISDGEALSGISKDSNCTYRVPYYSLKSLGLSSGGWDFNCGANGLTTHPIKAGGGKCAGKSGNTAYASGDYVTFSHYADTYEECPEGTYCWAHPFLGMVPAPGRYVGYKTTAGNERLYAQDEGVCPDGYQAVVTVTPTVFEMGKVQFVNSEKRPENAAVSYNPGWQNYANSDIQSVTGLMQASTKLGLIVEPLIIPESKSQLAGWKIAMGTVTSVSDSINQDSYIWNAGGIPANSWSAIAHTYCYFNPARFNMPNMRFMTLEDTGESNDAANGTSNVILTPMDNPLVGKDEMK